MLTGRRSIEEDLDHPAAQRSVHSRLRTPILQLRGARTLAGSGSPRWTSPEVVAQPHDGAESDISLAQLRAGGRWEWRRSVRHVIHIRPGPLLPGASRSRPTHRLIDGCRIVDAAHTDVLASQGNRHGSTRSRVPFWAKRSTRRAWPRGRHQAGWRASGRGLLNGRDRPTPLPRQPLWRRR
jgi:hypothetical protein